MSAKSKTIATTGDTKTKLGKAMRSLWFAPVILLGAFIFAFMSVLWLIQTNTHTIKQNQLVDNAKSTAESIHLRLKGNQDYLLLLAKERGDGLMDAKSFQERASHYVADHPEMICINWVNADYLITDVAPIAPNKEIVGLRLDLPEPKLASRLARETRQPVYTHPFVVIQGDVAFELWVPDYHNDVFLGLFGGIYSYEKLLRSLVGPQVLNANNISVVDTSGKVLLELSLTGTVDEKLVYQVSLTSPENGGLLQLKGYGAGPFEQGLLLLELICVAFVIGIVYAMWRLKREIEASKHAEKSRRETEDKFKYVFEYSNVGKSITLPTGEISTNKALADMFGYTREEVQNKKWQEITHPDDIELTQRNVDQLLSGEQNRVRFSKRFIHKNGSVVWVDLSSVIRRDKNGKPLYLITSIIDITERKQTEEAQKENERVKSELLEKFNDAQHIAIIGSWEWNLQTDQVWWSDETYRIFGVTQENFVPSFEANGKFIHPDDFAAYGKIFEHSLKTGEPLDCEFRLVTNDGVLKHCRGIGKIIYGDSGQQTRFIGTVMDITERRQAEDALRESEQRFHLMFEKHDAIMLLIEPQTGLILDANQAATKFYGYTKSKLCEMSINEINSLPPEQVAVERQKALA